MEHIYLSLLKSGEVGKVYSLNRKCKGCKRLSELGINKGVEVRMIKNDVGPIVLTISGHKLAIGRCLANKILITVKNSNTII